MWNRLGEMEDTKCMVPDRCYATMYQEIISYLKSNNQFDVVRTIYYYEYNAI